VAFPLISAGNHGFPKDKALKIAMDTIRDFLMENEMQVYLVVFSRDAFQLSEKLFRGVSSFIDEHYVQEKNFQQYGVADKCSIRGLQQAMTVRQQMIQEEALRWSALEEEEEEADIPWPPCPTCPVTEDVGEEYVQYRSSPRKEEKKSRKKILYDGAPAPVSRRLPKPQAKPTLAQLLAQTDAGFSETLLKLIDQTGKKDSEIYAKANVTRQHFSKIRNNPHYKPTKATAIAFAIALELDLEQTRDLIGRAGYALTNSSKFDVIIMYFIGEKNYNLFDINAALFEFDQTLLGA